MFVQKEKEARAAQRIRSRLELSTDTSVSLNHCRGDELVRNVLRTLDSFRTDNGDKLIRSREQKLFHFLWLQAFFPFIYAHNWHSHSERVLANLPILFGFPQAQKRIFYEVLCLTPRRYGKTWAVAMFIAAMIYEIPGIKFANFSTGRRASGFVMDDVLRFFRQLPDGDKRILKSNQERLEVTEFAMDSKSDSVTCGRVSTFSSYPSTKHGTCCLCDFAIVFAGRDSNSNDSDHLEWLRRGRPPLAQKIRADQALSKRHQTRNIVGQKKKWMADPRPQFHRMNNIAKTLFEVAGG